jgi:hypothetical protein
MAARPQTTNPHAHTSLNGSEADVDSKRRPAKRLKMEQSEHEQNGENNFNVEDYRQDGYRRKGVAAIKSE